MNRTLVELIIDKVEGLKIGHRYCEDSWYSCPKAPDGCDDVEQGDECNCPAEKHNAEVDEVIEKLRLLL